MNGPSEADDQEHRGARDQRETKPARADPRRILQPGHHHQHPHRGQDRAALKGAARFVRADPEHLDADHDADRREHAGEEDERGVGRRAPERRRRAAPEPVRRDRPHADHREHEHDLLEHGVERAIGDEHRGHRVAETGRGEVPVRVRGERGRGIGQIPSPPSRARPRPGPRAGRRRSSARRRAAAPASAGGRAARPPRPAGRR